MSQLFAPDLANGIEERVEFAARAGEGEGGGRSREGAGKEGGRKDRGRRTSLMRNTYPKRPRFPFFQLGARLMRLRVRFLRLMRLGGVFFAPNQQNTMKFSCASRLLRLKARPRRVF